MNSQKQLKIEMINKLIAELEQKTDEYNHLMQPQQDALIARNTEARLGIATAPRSSAPLFSPDIKNKLKMLDGEIKELTKKIEQLDKELYGKSDRTSPSFTMPRR